MNKAVILLLAGLLLWSAGSFAWVWPDDPYVNLGDLQKYLLDDYALTIEDQIEAETFFQMAAESATVIVREAGWAENEAFAGIGRAVSKMRLSPPKSTGLSTLTPVPKYSVFSFTESSIPDTAGLPGTRRGSGTPRSKRIPACSTS